MENTRFLEHVAYNLRVDALRATTTAGSGHVTSCLSAADIAATLFFHTLQFDPDVYNNVCNDRFILSKGHAAPLLYAVWKQLGKVSDKELLSLRKFTSNLEGHPTARFAYSEAATGSLGQGLSIGVGMALAARADSLPLYTYVLLGDSEMTEGSNWEAIEIAAHYKLNNLIAIVDVNRLGQSIQTIQAHDCKKFENKFKAFGWQAFIVDGHNVQELVAAFDKARSIKNRDQPTVIIAKTFKGYGLNDTIEDQQGFHGKVVPEDKLVFFLEKLAERFPEAAQYKPTGKEFVKKLPVSSIGSGKKEHKKTHSKKVIGPDYKKGDLIATRKAYGQALVACGKIDKAVVSLDAEVKNSTFAELFENAFPGRFYQCFIAEQNMVGMAAGMQKRGKIPFVSTFGCFLSRAHDQIRMAAVGQSPLRMSGSHAGVSIGEDGPSQMGLEDLAMMRALPESIVFYPCDAVSAHNCVALMHEYNNGISYIRTTRMKTSVIYDNKEQFIIGGCKQLKTSDKDVVCVVAAGVTVFEALTAYKLLVKQNIFMRVIDCYSIKPLPTKALIEAVAESGSKLITVEDHYLEGGLGQAVTYALRDQTAQAICLAVSKLPRSGTPEELLADHGIDAQAIVRAVKQLVAK